MTNQYDVSLNNGDSYTVNTPKHHDDHTDDVFKAHLLDVIKQTTATVGAALITRYVFKQRLKR